MQMAVIPAHDDLDDVMHDLECGASLDLNAPPDGGLGVKQCHKTRTTAFFMPPASRFPCAKARGEVPQIRLAG
jgi:hypothetical protein